MREGKPIIYQATFFDGQFIGHADFLRRVEHAPSHLGDYSYEVIDTKLGLSARPYYLVQLCNYSEHLERLQGRMPDYGYVVFGDGDERALSAARLYGVLPPPEEHRSFITPTRSALGTSRVSIR